MSSLKPLVFVLGLAGLCACEHSGLAQEPERKANQASKKDAGSAKRMVGEIRVYEYFVVDEETTWSPEDRLEVNRRMESAIWFLERHAGLHAKSVRFVRIGPVDVTLAHPPPSDPYADPAWTRFVTPARNSQSAAESAGAKWPPIDSGFSGSDQEFHCVHLNRRGLSYNLAYYEGVHQDYAVERTVCFFRYPDGRPTSSATYAHEILHLFGAGDLYFPYDQTTERKREAGRSFPDDIMYRVDYDLGRLNIGGFTAFRIGWLEAIRPEWRRFED